VTSGAAPTGLAPEQRALLDAWLPGHEVVADLGWGLIATTVLRVRAGDDDLVVKAGGPGDHHIGREIRAHLDWLGPWTPGRAPTLLHHDRDARLLVTRWLPGDLVLGTPAQDDPDTYRQAGALLAALHGQAPGIVDDGWEARENARTLVCLDRPHRIDPATVRHLRALIGSWPRPPAVLVPTHGDWQPRNWLRHEGEVRVIDLGRADLRPAASDLTRLAQRDFRRSPGSEEAFLDGYGHDPREAGAWRRVLVREAVGTIVWAYAVGAEDFESEGHALLAELRC
jgi:hypothetical protein